MVLLQFSGVTASVELVPLSRTMRNSSNWLQRVQVMSPIKSHLSFRRLKALTEIFSGNETLAVMSVFKVLSGLALKPVKSDFASPSNF